MHHIIITCIAKFITFYINHTDTTDTSDSYAQLIEKINDQRKKCIIGRRKYKLQKMLTFRIGTCIHFLVCPNCVFGKPAFAQIIEVAIGL